VKKHLLLPIVFTCLAVAGCADKTGTPVEISKACVAENEKKYIETGGFLDDRGSVFCSNRGGRMECSFNLKETADGEKRMSAYIATGGGANQMDELKSGYRREDIRIRDNAGNVINLADKVKLTGELNVTPDAKVCFLNVMKIERQ
jgi:hypothetical protein